MCGRVIQKTPAQAVASTYGARMEEEVTLFEPGEYTAGGQVLSIEASEDGREASIARWGLRRGSPRESSSGTHGQRRR